MSGETEREESAWTTDTLRQHLDELARERIRRLDEKIGYEAKLAEERDKRYHQQFQAQDVRYEQRFQAQEQASMYLREVTNEFRGQLSDQQSTFITRTETLAR